MADKVKVYTSKGCTPCQEVKDQLAEMEKQGLVDLIELDTDEGFEMFAKEVLENGDGEVPSAYLNGKKCKILYDEDDKISIDCPDSKDS